MGYETTLVEINGRPASDLDLITPKLGMHVVVMDADDVETFGLSVGSTTTLTIRTTVDGTPLPGMVTRQPSTVSTNPVACVVHAIDLDDGIADVTFIRSA
jgi:hypothetical protein